MKKILISTGGSGGHVIPSLSIYDHLKKEFNVCLVTDRRGSKFIDENLYKFDIVDVPNISSKIYLLPINLIFFLISFFKSFFYLKKNKIDFLISTGGYMSLAFCFASKILGIEIILFEPNAVIGRSNKLILQFSKRIICYHKNIPNFPRKYLKKIYLINPILKKEIYNLNLNLNNNFSNEIKILIIGGSQGAIFFDKAIEEVIKILSKNYRIKLIQQIFDDKKIEKLKEVYVALNVSYQFFKYEKDLYKKFEGINLAISRCGASTLSELSYAGIPFIAVPFPFAKDNHQYYNAKHYKDHNLCWLIEQKDFIPVSVGDFIHNLFTERVNYQETKTNLNKYSYQNTWNNKNQKLINLINEN